MDCWIKAGTYNITSTSVNTSGGPLYDTLGGIDANNEIRWLGYNATRGDNPARGSRPTFVLQNSLTVADIRVIDYEGAAKKFTELGYVDINTGTGNTASRGIRTATNFQHVHNISVTGVFLYGVVMWDYEQQLEDWEVFNFTGTAVKCDFAVATTTIIRRGIVRDGSGSTGGIDCFGFEPTVEYVSIHGVTTGILIDHSGDIKNLTIANCTTGLYKVDRGAATTGIIENAIFWNCTTALFSENNQSCAGSTITNCAFGSNGTNLGTGWTTATQTANVTLTGDPFTNLASDDLTLDSTAGEGAACRNAGTSGLDIGRYQVLGPSFASASLAANGVTLTLNLWEANNPPVLPAASAGTFEVRADGVVISASEPNRTDNDTYSITLLSTVYVGQAVTIAYTAGNVTDSASSPNSMASFAAQSVTNNSTEVEPAGGGGIGALMKAFGSGFGF
jgi:hypothetical protein